MMVEIVMKMTIPYDDHDDDDGDDATDGSFLNLSWRPRKNKNMSVSAWWTIKSLATNIALCLVNQSWIIYAYLGSYRMS